MKKWYSVLVTGPRKPKSKAGNYIFYCVAESPEKALALFPQKIRDTLPAPSLREGPFVTEIPFDQVCFFPLFVPSDC